MWDKQLAMKENVVQKMLIILNIKPVQYIYKKTINIFEFNRTIS